MMDENALVYLSVVLVWIVLLPLCIAVVVWERRRRKKRSNAGYEALLKKGNASGSRFFVKDGEFFYLGGIATNPDPDKAKPIEVVGVTEITRNTRLVQLEIRFRMDGVLLSERVYGTPAQLLAMEDGLGYGG